MSQAQLICLCRSFRYRCLLIVSACFFIQSESLFAQWSVESGLSSIAIASNSSESEGDEEDMFTSSLLVNPYATLVYSGRRLNVETRAGVLGNYNFQSREMLTLPDVSINVAMPVLGRLGLTEFSARASKRSQSDSPEIDEILSNLESSATQYDYQVSQQLQKSIQHHSLIRGGYRFAVSEIHDDVNVRGNTHVARVEMLNVLKHSGAGIVTGVQYQTTDIGLPERQYGGQFFLGIYVPVRSNLTVILATGYDWLDLRDGQPDRDGPFQYISTRWRPFDQLDILASYNVRRIGHQPLLSVTYEGRRGTIDFLYTRTVTFDRGGEFDVLQPGEFSLTGGQQANLDASIDNSSVTSSSDTFSPVERLTAIEEELSLSYLYPFRVTEFRVSIGLNKQRQIDDELELSNTRFVRASGIRSYGRNISAGLELTASSSSDSLDESTELLQSARITVDWLFN